MYILYECQVLSVKTTETLTLVLAQFHITTIATTVVFICAMSLTLPAVEAERVNPRTLSSDSSSATAVGLFFGGLAAGTLGVLLIVAIVGGACLLRKSKHK